MRRTTTDGGGMVSNITYRDGQRGIMTLHRHAKRVTNQQNLNAFVSKQAGKTKIVSGQRREFLPLALH